MIHIKCFFRKRTTKIYIILHSFLAISLIIISIILQYYQNQKSYIYRDSSYFILQSKNDLLEELKNDLNIINLHKVALLDKSNLKIENNEFDINFLADCDNDFVIVYYNEKYKEKISDGNAYIEISEILIENKKVLINDKLEINQNDEKTSFNIKDIIPSNFSRIILSKNDFNKISSGNVYIFNLKDYSNLNIFIEQYSDAKNYSIKFVQYYNGMKIIDTLDAIENIINMLKKICVIVLLIFCVCFIIITENIINDEFAEMYIEKLIGYSKNTIRKIVCEKIIIVDIIIITITFIFSYFLKIICQVFLKFDFLCGNINILYIGIFIIFSSMFMCFLYKDKNYKFY